MQIDWLTVAAQIVNFLVLVWLLQRFLYAPISRAMERRERRIAERLRQADRSKDEAEHERRRYQEQQEELERRRHDLLAAARDAAETERRALERAARERIEAQRREWEAQLEAQRDAFLRDLRQRSVDHFYALARRALGDLANADLEDQIALAFAARLEALDADTKRKIASECGKAGGAVSLRSRFELSAHARRQITKAIHEDLVPGAQVAYETDDGIACGITLKTGGQTVSWNLDSYFEGLERQLGEYLPGGPAAPAERAAG